VEVAAMTRAFALPGLLLAVAAAGAQQPITRTTTTGVVIDVSVVDRKGQAVTDLRPDEFELEEDGKRQEILAVTLMRGGVMRSVEAIASTAAVSTPPANAQPTAAPAGPSADGIPSITAMLYDGLTPESRPWAHKAAVAYLATLSLPTDYAGIFVVGQQMQTLSSFTNDSRALGAAASRLLTETPPRIAVPESARSGLARVQALPIDPNLPPTVGAEFGFGWINPLEAAKYFEGSDPETLLRLMEMRMYESFFQFLTDLEGETSLASLRAVVRSMAPLPGRKSIVYFAETIALSDRVKPKFEAVIQEANRHNITFYTVDVAGLRVHSEQARVGRSVDVAGAQGVGDVQRGSGAWTKDLEKQEQLVSSSGALARLAKDTGGFLIENTNNLGAGVARMQQERTTYYLLGYQPANTAQDGKFRKIGVKVKRPGVTVRARPGYVAGKRQP
jgi:VWFA-related protein